VSPHYNFDGLKASEDFKSALQEGESLGEKLLQGKKLRAKHGTLLSPQNKPL
jgi:hypothetical protein